MNLVLFSAVLWSVIGINSAIVTIQTENTSSHSIPVKKEKRGVFGFGVHGNHHYPHQYDELHQVHYPNHLHHHHQGPPPPPPPAPVNLGAHFHTTVTKKIGVPIPYPFPVKVPIPIYKPYAVPVDRPVPVPHFIPHPYVVNQHLPPSAYPHNHHHHNHQPWPHRW